jgi:hypothetical protein
MHQYILRSLPLNSFEETVKNFNDSLNNTIPILPKVKLNLQLLKIKGQNGWGYETAIKADSLARGEYILEYWMECPDPTYVLSTTELWQFDQNHNQLDYVGEGNRFNYKKSTDTEYLFTAKISVKNDTKKIVLKVAKYNQKEKHELKIREAVLYSNF